MSNKKKHAERSHALLAPSAASRWLKCTRSARLEDEFPETTSTFADEGTLAHTLGELLLQDKINPLPKAAFDARFKEIEDNELYAEEMYEYAMNYAVFCMERFSEAQTRNSDAVIYLEQQIKLDTWVPDSFGHIDVAIVSDDVLEIVDLKYGKGVPVSAVENKQEMLYALGAYEELSILFAIKRVRMSIFQPRIDNISTWEMPVTELLLWADTELKEKARLAFNGSGEYVAGDHCRFCKAKGPCRANAEMNLKMAMYDFRSTDLLTEGEIADILTASDNFTKWVKGVAEYALDQANKGVKWPGFKLVEGRSVRKYSDAEAVAKLLLEQEKLSENDIYNKKLLGLGAMEKQLGSAKFNSLLKPYLIKPSGAPTLVPVADKRPELNTADRIREDFASLEVEAVA